MKDASRSSEGENEQKSLEPAAPAIYCQGVLAFLFSQNLEGGFRMPKYLMQVSLTKDGVKGVAKDGGTKRRQAAEQFFKSAGGKLEALYFAFGDTDVFAIVDFPDNVSAAAISLAGNGAGQANVKATVAHHPRGDGPGRTKKPRSSPTGCLRKHKRYGGNENIAGQCGGRLLMVLS
jgi:uncharacterized protein with GYD domain